MLLFNYNVTQSHVYILILCHSSLNIVTLSYFQCNTISINNINRICRFVYLNNMPPVIMVINGGVLDRELSTNRHDCVSSRRRTCQPATTNTTTTATHAICKYSRRDYFFLVLSSTASAAAGGTTVISKLSGILISSRTA